jgi:transcriptional antiterminator RfaH
MWPSDLLEWSELEQDPVDGQPRWWALYSRPRFEKKLMRWLRLMEIPHFGPLIPRKRRTRSGRVRTAYLPLFTSYVFLFGTAEQRYEAMTTDCVSHWRRVNYCPKLTADLRNIRQLIDSGLPLSPERRLRPGMRVVVRSGTLAGIEGVIIRRHGKERLLVAVDFIQQGASVLLADFEVERIDW